MCTRSCGSFRIRPSHRGEETIHKTPQLRMWVIEINRVVARTIALTNSIIRFFSLCQSSCKDRFQSIGEQSMERLICQHCAVCVSRLQVSSSVLVVVTWSWQPRYVLNTFTGRSGFPLLDIPRLIIMLVLWQVEG